MSRVISVGVCQMGSRIGDVAHNLAQAERLADEAFGRGARWVVLPEFFPTGMAFHADMDGLGQPMDGRAAELLRTLARRHSGMIGGSFIAERNGEAYNTFLVCGPDGDVGVHDKDIPTMWEGCYYRGGDDPGVLALDGARVGAVICWEFLRWRTAARLREQVEVILGCSGWWTFPQGLGWALSGQRKRADAIMPESLAKMARAVGVPVAHAGQAGRFVGRTPLVPGMPYRSHFLGNTCVLDRDGSVLAAVPPGRDPGVAVAEVTLGPATPTVDLDESMWTLKLPWTLAASWKVLNAHARRRYRRRKTPEIQVTNPD